MKNNIVRNLLCAIVALAVAAAAFTAGFFVRGCTGSGAVSSYEWGLNTITEHYYFGGAENGFTETSLQAIAEKYLDRYSEYYTPEQYSQTLKSNSGSKSGLGISYSYINGRGVYVSSVVGNSPAYRGGLRAGDWLKSGTSSDGQNVEFNSSSDFQNLINSEADGEKFGVTAADGKVYTISKSEYTASYTYLCTNDTAWIFGDSAEGGLSARETVSEKIDYLPDGAAYIRLSQFYGTAAPEFSVLVEKFNAMNCSSLILDLRSNGGGYVSVMQDIAGAFSGGTKKLAMLSRDKRGKEEKFECTVQSNPQRRIGSDVKVYVLANSGTASASEALIGAMVCYGALSLNDIFISDYSEEYMGWLNDSRQELKNARTYGKGIMQSTFVNGKTGEALKLTTAKIFWPDGTTSIHDKGLSAADGCRLVKAEWQHTKPDDELKRAVEIIQAA